MEITADQIDFIRKDIEERGVFMEDLVEDLVDHICCVIESCEEEDFHSVYQTTLQSFGKNGMLEIQQETTYLLVLKRKITIRRSMYILGYIGLSLSSTGTLFKFQHWPYASIILTLGIAILNLGFLPMYFYDKYSRELRSLKAAHTT